jgi:hypothetical protein
VAAPLVSVKYADIGNDAGTHGIQVNVAHELEQIRFFLYQNRLEAPLKQVAVPMVPSIEATGIASQEPVAEAGDAERSAGPEEQVSMLWGAVGYVQWVA